MSNPTYFTGTSTRIASGLRSSAQTSSDAGLRVIRFLHSQDSVRPESTMSSTTSTFLPSISRSRSLRIRTTPDDDVAEPYELTAMNSNWTGTGSALARSVMNITAPLSTPTSSRSPAGSIGWSAATCAASSSTLAWISSSVINTDAMSSSYKARSLRCRSAIRSIQQQPAMRPAHDQPARQPHAALATPPADQVVSGPQLGVREFAHTAGQQPRAQGTTSHG